MEKAGYRETLQWLSEQGVPFMMSKKEAEEMLGVSRKTLLKMIDKGELKAIGNKIPIASVARALC